MPTNKNKQKNETQPVFPQFIIDRPDLFAAQNTSKVTGLFFTPKILVDKSKEYLTDVFGKNWQNEYFVWDCAAGIGNLLTRLSNKYNVWASDIDPGNVKTILRQRSLIDCDENLNLIPDHVFQFDFLNDSFDKLPMELKTIIDDPEKRKKLIIYINPPYAKTSSYGIEGRLLAADETKIFSQYKNTVGTETLNTLYVQFFVRIFHELPDAKIASFCRLRFITSHKLLKFWEIFLAQYKAGFICKPNTFDNVDVPFPAAFLIFDTEEKENITEIKADVLLHDTEQKNAVKQGEKIFRPTNVSKPIEEWRKTFYDPENESIGSMIIAEPNRQSNTGTFITNKPVQNDIDENMVANISKNNLTEMCIYFAVQECFEETWLNDRDQFRYPHDDWKKDIGLRGNCLIFTLFHEQNRISSNDGINRWIPFTEEEVHSRKKFDSDFMSKFVKQQSYSMETWDIINAGKKLWKYYHKKIKDNKTAPVNASLYDIRVFFQGHNDNGIMNTKSGDETYNKLITVLQKKICLLTKRIQPKVYKYGILKK
ncbi:MAG: hypothetical protein LBU34_01470 [Planctomycetaceae bacterium]|jgi:16S rRNA G966 N2-methylase RsmD|nr:hypothetical protein [Planctomycetaceae bacterium]